MGGIFERDLKVLLHLVLGLESADSSKYTPISLTLRQDLACKKEL